jgi:hypothetical protein
VGEKREKQHSGFNPKMKAVAKKETGGIFFLSMLFLPSFHRLIRESSSS